MGITGNLQLGGGGGVTDIKEAYTVANSGAAVTNGDSPYTVTDTGSVIVYVNSSGGAVTIGPNASPLTDDRIKVIDVGGAALTNNITVTGLGVINSNNASMEWRYSGSAWQQLEDDRTSIVAKEEAGSTAPNAATDTVRFFLDTEKDNILSIIDESGNVYIIDEFVDTNATTLANLESTYPAANFSGKKAIVAGTTSQNGIYQSNGSSWTKIADEVGDLTVLPSYSGGITYDTTNELITSANAGTSYVVDVADDTTNLSALTPNSAFDGNTTTSIGTVPTLAGTQYIVARIWDSASIALGQFACHSRNGSTSRYQILGYHTDPVNAAGVVDSNNYDVLSIDSITVNAGDTGTGVVVTGGNTVDQSGTTGGTVTDVDVNTLNTTEYIGYGILITATSTTPGANSFREMEGYETIDNTDTVTPCSEIKQLHEGYSKNTEGTAITTTGTTLTDADYIIELDASGGAFTQNLPAVANVKTGKRYLFKKIDSSSNAITLDGATSETIDGATTNATALATQWDEVEIINNGTAWLIINENNASTAKVTAAGALMDSELTDLAGIKALTVADKQDVLRSVSKGHTVGTGGQGTGAITTDVCEIATGNANDDVTLPAAAAGKMVYIINNTANTLDIYPASGDDASAGVDTVTNIATAKTQLYIALDATTWQKIELN